MFGKKRVKGTPIRQRGAALFNRRIIIVMTPWKLIGLSAAVITGLSIGGLTGAVSIVAVITTMASVWLVLIARHHTRMLDEHVRAVLSGVRAEDDITLREDNRIPAKLITLHGKVNGANHTSVSEQ
jgi:hypothetical protein